MFLRITVVSSSDEHEEGGAASDSGKMKAPEGTKSEYDVERLVAKEEDKVVVDDNEDLDSLMNAFKSLKSWNPMNYTFFRTPMYA